MVLQNISKRIFMYTFQRRIIAYTTPCQTIQSEPFVHIPTPDYSLYGSLPNFLK